MKKNSELNLSKEEEILYEDLVSLKRKLDEFTIKKFNRLNPFMENLTNWKERGKRYADETSLYDSATIIGDVKIGKNCWIGPFCLVDGSGGLEIGDYCVLATGAQVLTHETIDFALTEGKAPYKHKKTKIENGVFISTHAIITSGVTIGHNTLICANATVTKDIPPYSIAGGTPAKVIGEVIISGDKVKYKYYKNK